MKTKQGKEDSKVLVPMPNRKSEGKSELVRKEEEENSVTDRCSQQIAVHRQPIHCRHSQCPRDEELTTSINSLHGHSQKLSTGKEFQKLVIQMLV